MKKILTFTVLCLALFVNGVYANSSFASEISATKSQVMGFMVFSGKVTKAAYGTPLANARIAF